MKQENLKKGTDYKSAPAGGTIVIGLIGAIYAYLAQGAWGIF
jgi:hypothetical protein